MNSNTVKIDELKQNNANPSPLTVTFSKTSLSPGGIPRVSGPDQDQQKI